jgi:hypothetical protein
MKDYKDYSTDDFIGDDSFIHWVKFPTKTTMDFGSLLLLRTLTKRRTIEEAIRFLKLFGDQQLHSRRKVVSAASADQRRIDVPVSASTCIRL